MYADAVITLTCTCVRPRFGVDAFSIPTASRFRVWLESRHIAVVFHMFEDIVEVRYVRYFLLLELSWISYNHLEASYTVPSSLSNITRFHVNLLIYLLDRLAASSISTSTFKYIFQLVVVTRTSAYLALYSFEGILFLVMALIHTTTTLQKSLYKLPAIKDHILFGGVYTEV
ncbi:hypothetical protein F5Y04DRAFT_104102 [Hypomontagnella monticulosa]|nr:hypothetical protein F5Y04DRAFT_104102 [Hypomontagnella monticulosa]